jgi:2-hydroxy-3-oxopropionate reductase
MLQTLRADGYGQDDHSGIAKYYEKVAGAVIRK